MAFPVQHDVVDRVAIWDTEGNSVSQSQEAGTGRVRSSAFCGTSKERLGPCTFGSSVPLCFAESEHVGGGRLETELPVWGLSARKESK